MIETHDVGIGGNSDLKSGHAARLILLVRHGQSPSNRDGRIVGRSDERLTPLGRLQLEQLVAHLGRYGVERIRSSDSPRAVESAGILQSLVSAPVQVTSRLAERDLGAFEGLGRDCVTSILRGRGLSCTGVSSDWRGVSDVESDERLWSRVAPLWNEWRKGNMTELWVTHANVIGVVLHSVLNVQRDSPPRFVIGNGCVSVLQEREGSIRLKELWTPAVEDSQASATI